MQEWISKYRQKKRTLRQTKKNAKHAQYELMRDKQTLGYESLEYNIDKHTRLSTAPNAYH